MTLQGEKVVLGFWIYRCNSFKKLKGSMIVKFRNSWLKKINLLTYK